MQICGRDASCCPPEKYAARFANFVTEQVIARGNWGKWATGGKWLASQKAKDGEIQLEITGAMFKPTPAARPRARNPSGVSTRGVAAELLDTGEGGQLARHQAGLRTSCTGGAADVTVRI